MSSKTVIRNRDMVSVVVLGNDAGNIGIVKLELLLLCHCYSQVLSS